MSASTPRPRKPVLRRILPILGSAVLLIIIGVILWRKRYPVHQHCMKGALFWFYDYAETHDGRFPESERGWGDALLALVSLPGYEGSIPLLVGVDDDGSRLLRALRTGEDVSEAECTRIYVQGLNTKSNGNIALFFDRHAVGGGDHFRSPFRKPLREVLTVGMSHEMIAEADWPRYVRTQRELLRNEGFSEEEIDHYYGSTMTK